MSLDKTDANTETASSPSPAPEAPADDKTNETAAASAAAEPQPGATEEAPETLADIVAQRQETASQAETEAEGEAAPGPVPEGDKTEEGKKTDESEALPPFHEHPAWKRVVEERNSARAELQQSKDLADAQNRTVDYCKQNDITPEQFRQGLEIMSLINRDPQKAYAQIDAIRTELGKFAGETLPADLQARVDSGNLAIDDAKEIASARAGKVIAENGVKRTVARTEAERRAASEAESERQMTKAMVDWSALKKKTDPDFDRKVKMIRDRTSALLPGASVKTAADLVALAEKAYAEVNKETASFAPVPPKRRVLTANGASGKTVPPEPKTMAEAIARGLKDKHGISYTPNGR